MVDDGSRDRTPEILERATAEIPFLRVVRRPDRGFRKLGGGVIDAFYEGLASVDIPYDFVAKMDVDLEFSPRYLERILEYFERDPQARQREREGLSPRGKPADRGIPDRRDGRRPVQALSPRGLRADRWLRPRGDVGRDRLPPSPDGGVPDGESPRSGASNRSPAADGIVRFQRVSRASPLGPRTVVHGERLSLHRGERALPDAREAPWNRRPPDHRGLPQRPPCGAKPATTILRSAANSGAGNTIASPACFGAAGLDEGRHDSSRRRGVERPTVDLAGLALAKLTRQEVVDHLFGALAEGEGGWVVTPNVDYLRRYVADSEVRRLFADASLIVADGVPLLWAARLQGTPLPDRIAGSDLVWLLAERAAREGRSLYLLGGNEGAGEEAARRLVDRWPSLRIAGTSSPRVSRDPTEVELASILRSLKQAQPDLIYVGLGAPKEERLIAALRTELPRTWWIGVGVSISFIAGDVRRAPLWMQRTGLEWAHRLVQEPRRLARRYLAADVPFTVRLLAASWRRRWGTR